MYSACSSAFKGMTLDSPVFSYSSRFSLVDGGLLKLYGESLFFCLSLKRVFLNQCLMTLRGRPVCADILFSWSSAGELLMSKLARRTLSWSSVILVLALFSAFWFCCWSKRFCSCWLKLGGGGAGAPNDPLGMFVFCLSGIGMPICANWRRFLDSEDPPGPLPIRFMTAAGGFESMSTGCCCLLADIKASSLGSIPPPTPGKRPSGGPLFPSSCWVLWSCAKIAAGMSMPPCFNRFGGISGGWMFIARSGLRPWSWAICIRRGFICCNWAFIMALWKASWTSERFAACWSSFSFSLTSEADGLDLSFCSLVSSDSLLQLSM